MTQTVEEITLEIEESIRQLRNGTATLEDVSRVKEYLVDIDKILVLFSKMAKEDVE